MLNQSLPFQARSYVAIATVSIAMFGCGMLAPVHDVSAVMFNISCLMTNDRFSY